MGRRASSGVVLVGHAYKVCNPCADGTAGATGYRMTKAKTESLLSRHLRKAEKDFILKHLGENKGNVTYTAKALGISHRHLCRKLRAHEIDRSAT